MRVSTSPSATGSAGRRGVLRTVATIGLGRATLSRLTDGIVESAQRQHASSAVLVYRQRRRGIDGGYSRAPPGGPRRPHAPGCFARIVMRKYGLDPDRDLECVVRAPGAYQMDLRRFGTAPSTPPMWGARCHPIRSSRKKGSICWPGSAITSRSPPWASPWTRPTSRWTAPRCRRWLCQPTGATHDRRTTRVAVDYIASFPQPTHAR